MANQELELFVHAQGAKPRVVTTTAAEVLGEFLLRVGILPPGERDVLVFIGESEDALAESDDVDDGTDRHEPADIRLTVEALGVARHRHVHIHSCRHIATKVNFGGKTKHHRFSPATTIAVVTQWSRKKFHLEPAAAAEYVLQVCNSRTNPRPDQYLGELVHAPGCSICFDLVKEITPQG